MLSRAQRGAKRPNCSRHGDRSPAARIGDDVGIRGRKTQMCAPCGCFCSQPFHTLVVLRFLTVLLLSRSAMAAIPHPVRSGPKLPKSLTASDDPSVAEFLYALLPLRCRACSRLIAGVCWLQDDFGQTPAAVRGQRPVHRGRSRQKAHCRAARPVRARARARYRCDRAVLTRALPRCVLCVVRSRVARAQ